MPAVAPALRLPMVADDISTTADVLRFLQESLFALAKEGEATSPGAARGLYSIMGEQVARLDVVVGEVTEAAVIVGDGTATREREVPDTLTRRSQ